MLRPLNALQIHIDLTPIKMVFFMITTAIIPHCRAICTYSNNSLFISKAWDGRGEGLIQD